MVMIAEIYECVCIGSFKINLIYFLELIVTALLKNVNFLIFS